MPDPRGGGTKTAQDKKKDAAHGRHSLANAGGAYLAKSDSAKSETAVQERAKPYFGKPGN